METLSLFLHSFGPKTTILLIFGCLFSFFVIYIITAITGRNFGFDIGPLKINTKRVDGSDNTKLEKIKTLLKFENNTETENSLLDSMVNAIKTKTREKDVVELQQTIINQMRCAEDFNIQIKSLMTRSYANLLKEKDSTVDVRQHRDYKFYQVLVSTILDELKRNTLKESINSIEIDLLSAQEFDQFVEQKSSVMITLMIEYLDLMYQNNSIVSRDELYKQNQNLTKDITEAYRKMYSNIKSIIIEDKNYIKEINSQLDDNVIYIKNQINKNCIAIKIDTLLEENSEKKKG
jgi:hypothetical protein